MSTTPISQNGATDTVYIQDAGSGSIQYKVNNGDWTSISIWPVTIQNTSTTVVLKVLFTNNITLNSTNEQYFKCLSDRIQFGSPSLNSDGTRTIITIEGLTEYPGLIQNSTGTNGFENIYIYNLQVSSVDSVLLDNAGWIGQEWFGYEGSNNYIINCKSNGDIPELGGGIVGAASGGGIGGGLTLRGCSTTGPIGNYGGGIAGHASGSSSGSITCEKCFSEGEIVGSQGGGIFGTYGGNNNGSATATNCYSLGDIATDGGGIYGAYAAEYPGTAIASGCYSRGTIGTDAGGIFGRYAGYSPTSDKGVASATNCYSFGSITNGNGIFGSNNESTLAPTQCYSANNNWNNTNASSSLSGAPSGVGVGTTWVQISIDTPYELNGMGYTPYTIDIINSSSELVQNYSQTVEIGQSTVEAINPNAPSNNFTIKKKAGGNEDSYNTITINSQTGKISTTSTTEVGTYTLTIRSIGSYNITTFTLTIREASSTGGATAEDISCCSRPLDLKGVDYTTRNRIISGNILIGSTAIPRQPLSYSDIYNKKMAYASK